MTAAYDFLDGVLAWRDLGEVRSGTFRIGTVDPDFARAIYDLENTMKENTMTDPPANPYDRRRAVRGADAESGWAAPMMTLGHTRLARATRALSLADIEALVENAYSRGQVDATERLERQHADDLRREQADAWDEGHEVGVDAGWAALSGVLGERLNARVIERVHHSMRVLDDATRNPRAVTKNELLGHLAFLNREWLALMSDQARGFDAYAALTKVGG